MIVDSLKPSAELFLGSLGFGVGWTPRYTPEKSRRLGHDVVKRCARGATGDEIEHEGWKVARKDGGQGIRKAWLEMNLGFVLMPVAAIAGRALLSLFRTSTDGDRLGRLKSVGRLDLPTPQDCFVEGPVENHGTLNKCPVLGPGRSRTRFAQTGCEGLNEESRVRGRRQQVQGMGEQGKTGDEQGEPRKSSMT
ncbi:hypothetical protein ACCO45_008568 [Purpureocillium lilacinum]|uniref:Uncharacterized protein n=1 Tax=Purpureocillium lilacinum TaxID=33203 RepID=A0ACC4DNM5_PURLI